MVLQPAVKVFFDFQAHHAPVLTGPQLVLDRPQEVGSVFFGHVEVHVPHYPVGPRRQDPVTGEELGDEFLDDVINQDQGIAGGQLDQALVDIGDPDRCKFFRRLVALFVHRGLIFGDFLIPFQNLAGLQLLG